MSHSGQRSPFERRRDDQKAEEERDRAYVLCKHLVYLHQTARGGVLVQEDEDLGGKDGKKTWLPGQACRFHPPLNSLEPGDSVQVEMSKRLAVEKEMMYEEIP